jgi:hypothetical protein
MIAVRRLMKISFFASLDKRECSAVASNKRENPFHFIEKRGERMGSRRD